MPANYNEDFGPYLRGMRTSKGVGLRDLAVLCGISAGYLSRLELGTLACIPSADVLENMAEELGVDVVQMFCKAGRIPSDVETYLLANPKVIKRLLRNARAS